MHGREPGDPAAAAVPDTAADAWARRRTDQVLARAEALALDAVSAPAVRALLDTALIGLREHVRLRERTFCVHLPLLVYGCLRGDDEPAIPLAAATSIFYLGIDICDDLADGDLPAHWAGYRPSTINLAALAMLAPLPQLLLADLDAPAATRVAMQATLARGLVQMGVGQYRDVSAAGAADVSAADVEESIAAKSGEEVAIFTALAAHLAEAPPERIEQYAALGCALGTAAQLGSDCLDLFGAPHSKDIAAGTRTLPIVLGLNRLEGGARADFLALLEQAQHDEAAGAAVRQQLQAAGVLRRCAFTIEVYRQRALRLLDAADAREPARGRLRWIIENVAGSTR